MPVCANPDCRERAFNGPLCNYHALLAARAAREARESETLEHRAHEVRERAAELGLTLDERAATRAAAQRKVRSPVS